jgi:hypothetical protein
VLFDGIGLPAKQSKMWNQFKMHQLVCIIVHGVCDASIVENRRLVMRSPAIQWRDAWDTDSPPEVVVVKPFDAP